MTTDKPELTAIQHRTRTRLLVAGAVAFTLVLGFVVLAADVNRTPTRTDASFWQRLWQGTQEQLRSAAQSLARIKSATTTPEKEARDLSKQVFPEFTR